MRKFLVLMMLLLASCAYALELPDSVNEWQCVNEHIVTLTPVATGENLGRMVYRDYERESPRGYVQVILTEGTGTGSLYVPERVRAGGLMPSDSEYRILDIAGRKAILEHHENIPLSLAVDADNNVVLTIESSALDEEGLIEFAVNILQEAKISRKELDKNGNSNQ